MDPSNLGRSTAFELEKEMPSRRERLQGNPFFVFALAFISAWVYLIVPNCNYWVYSMVKNQWWVFLSVSCYIELQDSALMDASNITYYCSYFVGFLTPPFVHLIAYLIDQEDNYTINVLAHTTSIIVVLCSYAVDVIRNPFTNADVTRTGEITAPNRIGRAASVIYTFFDTFTASMTEAEANAVENGVECGSGREVSSSRSLWQRIRKEKNFTAAAPQARINSYQQQQQLINEVNHDNTPVKELPIENPLFRSSTDGNLRCQTPINCSESNTGKLDSWLLRWTYYLPRRVYLRMGIPTGRITVRDRRFVFVFASAFNILFNLYYYFLMFFTEYFQQKSSNGNNFEAVYFKSVLFFVFVVWNSLFRIVIKRCGMILDRCKEGTSSMYFLGEVMCLLFYYTFYRVLFESLTSWYEFAFFQFIHLFSEWILYPFRASRRFYDIVLGFQSRSGICHGCLLPTKLDHNDWLNFLSLDFGIRFSIMVSTGIFFLLFFLSIDFIPWITNSLKQEGAAMALSSEMITVAVLLEVLNAYVMNLVFFKSWNMSITGKVFNCFSDVRFAIIAYLLASCLYINPMFAFTTDNTYR